MVFKMTPKTKKKEGKMTTKKILVTNKVVIHGKPIAKEVYRFPGIMETKRGMIAL